MPQIKPDLKKVNEELQEIADAGKQAQEEALTADEELKKYGNAYNLFGERMQQARQQSAQARTEVEEDNVGALRATEYATQLRQRATMAQNSQEGRMLVAEAERETARADMLNKESAEASQSTQVCSCPLSHTLLPSPRFISTFPPPPPRLQLAPADNQQPSMFGGSFPASKTARFESMIPEQRASG